MSREDAQRELVARAARAHGIGTVKDIGDYYRLSVADTTRALHGLEDAGVVRQVSVEGWARPAFLHTEARIPRRIEATALLSPFDPVVWERDRALRLFPPVPARPPCPISPRGVGLPSHEFSKHRRLFIISGCIEFQQYRCSL